MERWIGISFFFVLAIVLAGHRGYQPVPFAYGSSLVFGPEFIRQANDSAQSYVKRFSVQDVHQRFLLSIQTKPGDKSAACAIKLNGEAIVWPGECRGMLIRPVHLQRQNDISIRISESGEASIMISIMELDEHRVSAVVPPVGKVVELPHHASIVFPGGSFDADQHVTIYDAATDSAKAMFEAGATGMHLPNEIRINTGSKAPQKDIEVDINIPLSFYASPYQIHIFALMHNPPDAPGTHDRFVKLSSSVDQVVMTVRTTLPRHAFSSRHSGHGTYEAVMVVGLVD